MRVLSLFLAAALWSGCGGSDISEDPPIFDASGSVVDSAPGTIDSAPGTIDSAPGTIDSAPGTPDADVNRAQVFCDRYDTLCGYDAANANRFDDEAACLGAFDTFDATQRDCVEGQLDAFETDGMLQHCGRAMGNGPCG